MKRRPSDLSKEEKIKTLDALYTAASSIHGRADIKLFLRDLLTESERIMLGRRIRIAKRIVEGKTRDEIAIEFRAGTDTIGKVQRWLDDQVPGYEKALSGMEKEYKARGYASPSPQGRKFGQSAKHSKNPLYKAIFG